METKICKKCNQEKDVSIFVLKKNGKLHSWCTPCRLLANKEWRELNKNKIIIYKEKTKERRHLKDSEYRKLHKEELRLKAALYNELSREKRKIYRLRPEIKERTKERGRKWRLENRLRYNDYFRKYHEKDIGKKMARNMRNYARKVFKGKISAIHAKGIFGCELDFFKQHMASQFTEGMALSNYGEWHIDHIIPCNAFDFNNPIHQMACFHWSNSQPMWGPENISKHDNYKQEDFDAYMKIFIEKYL